MDYFRISGWRPDGALKPWQTTLLIAGLILVFGFWFATRVYTFNHFQRFDNPVVHPMTKIFHDMAISMDEGHGFGEINVSRIMRNKDAPLTEPYPAKAEAGDEYRQFQTVDPGYGAVFWAARHIFFFIPDTVQRPIMLQLFFDAVLLFMLYFTFYRWGWFPAVASGLLYSANIVFAHAAATPWYHFWDGLICAAAFIRLLWLYRAAREEEPSKTFLILNAIGVGVVLGLGVWLRSSWFIFAPILLIGCLFSKTIRPWIIYSILAYGLLSGAMVWRATELKGEFAYSTRMSWHTAMQGLARNPNNYGLEDNDLYLFTRAHDEQGVNYNLTDYSDEDSAMQKNFAELWQNDPAFVTRSIAQRIFSNIFFNFDDQQQPLWNQGMVLFALIGLMFGAWLMGELGFLAILSAIMFGAINFGYGFVYYITREYAFATQMLLLFGVVTAIAGLCEIAKRLWHRDWFNFRDPNVNPALIVFAVSAFIFLVLLVPPVQQYLTPNPKISVNWDSPNGIDVMSFLGLQNQVGELTEAQRQKFIQFAKKETTQKSPGPDETVFQYAMQHLRHVTFTNRDGHSGTFWINKKTDDDSYQVLSRASDSITGVGYEWINEFDVSNPDTWQGEVLQFKLLPNDHLPPEMLDKLLTEKFSQWNWKLQNIGDNEYRAMHIPGGCSETRKQLAQYFSHQCGDEDAPVH